MSFGARPGPGRDGSDAEKISISFPQNYRNTLASFWQINMIAGLEKHLRSSGAVWRIPILALGARGAWQDFDARIHSDSSESET
jgi:hypothetical protein